MWRTFVEQIYRKRPAVLKRQELAGSGFTVDDGLAVAQALLAAQACNWTDGNAVRIQSPALAPEVLSSLHYYGVFVETIQRQLGKQQFVFSQHNCHTYAPSVKRRAQEFLQPLFDLVGIPSSGVNIILLAGHYQTTPAGLHNDPADIFLFPLIGGKRLLTWPHSRWDSGHDVEDGKLISRRLPEVEYEKFEQEATILDAEEGDVLYFPAGTWHLNAFDHPKDSMSLAISIFSSHDLRTVVNDIKSSAYEMAVENSLCAPTLGDVCEAFDRVSRIYQLQRASAGGFVTGRGVGQRNEVEASRRFRLRSKRTFVVPNGSSELILVSDGRAIAVPTSCAAERVVNAFLGQEDWIEVGRTDESLDASSDLEVVEALVSAGVLEAA